MYGYIYIYIYCNEVSDGCGMTGKQSVHSIVEVGVLSNSSE